MNSFFPVLRYLIKIIIIGMTIGYVLRVVDVIPSIILSQVIPTGEEP
jgi:hypothetical protein